MTDHNSPSDGLSVAAIARALEAIQERISRAEVNRKAAEDEIAVCREEERLLNGLLAIRRGDRSQASVEKNVAPQVSLVDGKPAMAAVVKELAVAGRPVHISELMRLLTAADIPIPGAGTQANLIAHMSRDPRIVRPSRGMYGLATWGLENMPASPRRHRRKRVRITADRSRNEHRTQ